MVYCMLITNHQYWLFIMTFNVFQIHISTAICKIVTIEVKVVSTHGLTTRGLSDDVIIYEKFRFWNY